MTWKKKKVLVTVKAYPEKSTKYGETVCVAGITEDNEFIRLYPVLFDYFRGPRNIPKYTWIEVECEKNDKEKLQRKESYKIRDGSIKIIDNSYVKSSKKWELRHKVVSPLISDSIETLKEKFKEDKTSLGLIKVHELMRFYSKEPLEEIELEESKFIQSTLFGEKKSILQKIPHVFRYEFKCCPSCNGHDMSVEDWEVFESFRSWLKYYNGDYNVMWAKMKEKYYDFMNQRDLYFYMGTDSQYGSWMIIGLYYPPK
jgi:hypothetical protein